VSTPHVVIGAGPVGHTVTDQLVEAGHPVRLITRSGSGPVHPLVERRAVDARDEAALRGAVEGAPAVFHCAHAAYSAKTWSEELPRTEQTVLAAAAGSVVVFPESLYAYSDPAHVMTEDSPRDATGGKRGIRVRLLAARAASATPTVSIVASDFFGPYARNAQVGERMLPRIIAGKRVRVAGSADERHSFTYVGDYARAVVAAAGRRDVWGRVLHAPTGPALTQRELVQAFAAAAGTNVEVSTFPAVVLRLGALAPGILRELAETIYQLQAPFVMSSTATEALLGLSPTPVEVAARETVAWWRQQAG